VNEMNKKNLDTLSNFVLVFAIGFSFGALQVALMGNDWFGQTVTFFTTIGICLFGMFLAFKADKKDE